MRQYSLLAFFNILTYFLSAGSFEGLPGLVFSFVLVSVMWTLSIFDICIYQIPDACIITGLFSRILFGALYEDVSALAVSLENAALVAIGLLVLDVLMSGMLGRQAMGYGDIKLFFMLGTCFSLYDDLLAVFLSSLLGIIAMIFTDIKNDELPFGPFICLAYLLIMIIK